MNYLDLLPDDVKRIIDRKLKEAYIRPRTEVQLFQAFSGNPCFNFFLIYIYIGNELLRCFTRRCKAYYR